MEKNLSTYLQWKEQCAAKGKTPNDMVGMYRGLLDDKYLNQVQRFIEEMEISLTQKGAAWIALRESGFINCDWIEEDEERFNLFWENFSEYQMPFVYDLIERTEEADEAVYGWKIKVAATVSNIIGIVVGALLATMVMLLQ